MKEKEPESAARHVAAVLAAAVSTAARASSAQTQLVLGAGRAGVARLARYHVGADLAAGRLAPLLENHGCGAVEEIHAVFVGPGRDVPARVRVLLDSLAERVTQDLA